MLSMLKRINELNLDHDLDGKEEIDLETATVAEMLKSMSVQEREAFEKVIESKEGLDVLIRPWQAWWDPNGMDDTDYMDEERVGRSVECPKLSDLISKPPNELIFLGMLDCMYITLI
jgi:hypothetical protein